MRLFIKVLQASHFKTFILKHFLGHRSKHYWSLHFTCCIPLNLLLILLTSIFLYCYSCYHQSSSTPREITSSYPTPPILANYNCRQSCFVWLVFSNLKLYFFLQFVCSLIGIWSSVLSEAYIKSNMVTVGIKPQPLHSWTALCYMWRSGESAEKTQNLLLRKMTNKLLRVLS